MLVERSASRDVQKLQPATNSKDRPPTGVRRLREGQFERVELTLDRAGIRVPVLAIRSRVQVRTTGQTDPGDPLQQRLQGIDAQRRNDDGNAARGFDRVEVLEPKRHLVLWWLSVRGG